METKIVDSVKEIALVVSVFLCVPKRGKYHAVVAQDPVAVRFVVKTGKMQNVLHWLVVLMRETVSFVTYRQRKVNV